MTPGAREEVRLEGLITADTSEGLCPHGQEQCNWKLL